MSQPEPTARDLEVVRNLCSHMTPAQHDLCVARALAAERARVEDQLSVELENALASRLAADAQLTRVLTLTPEEAGRLLSEYDENLWIATSEEQRQFFILLATRFLTALRARASG